MDTRENRLHIATAIDHTYLLPLRVMLASLVQHLRPSFRPILYIMNQTLNDEDLAAIGAIVETHSIVPPPGAVRSLPRSPRFLPEAAFPLLLPDLLPGSVERVLFLDPDLLILDDVAKVWETELGDCVIAAARDQAIPSSSSPRGVKYRSKLGVPDDVPYFNAGVMLIDIARWKALDISARAYEYLERRGERADYFHQEALNAVLWNRWIRLDQKWNLVASLSGRSYGPYKDDSIDAPGIVHFAGHFKPWRFRIGGPFAARYDEFVALCTDGEAPSPSLSESLLGIYDRHVRDYLYGFERALWKNRLI